MRKIFILIFIFNFLIFAEDKKEDVNKDTTILIFEKIDEIEKKIEKIEDEIKKINQEIDKIYLNLRNLEIYVKPAATVRPSEEKWNSIEYGMKKEEVEKILGLPEEIKVDRNKNETWFYYGVGYIIFNRYGELIEKVIDKRYPPRKY